MRKGPGSDPGFKHKTGLQLHRELALTAIGRNGLVSKMTSRIAPVESPEALLRRQPPQPIEGACIKRAMGPPPQKLHVLGLQPRLDHPEGVGHQLSGQPRARRRQHVDARRRPPTCSRRDPLLLVLEVGLAYPGFSRSSIPFKTRRACMTDSPTAEFCSFWVPPLIT